MSKSRKKPSPKKSPAPALGGWVVYWHSLAVEEFSSYTEKKTRKAILTVASHLRQNRREACPAS